MSRGLDRPNHGGKLPGQDSLAVAMNWKIPSMMSCVAMAASSRPEIFVSSMMPPGPSILDSISEKRIVSHMTMCARTTATMTAIHDPTFVHK